MKKSYSFLLLILFIVSIKHNVFSQSAIRKANKEFNNSNYFIAIDLYKKYLKGNKADLETTQKLADCYRLINNSKEAEIGYAQVLNFKDYDPNNIYYYAEALRNNGKYKEAKTQYLMYGNKMPEKREKAKILALSCEQALLWISEPQKIETSIESLNSNCSDFSPVFFDDGLVFTTDRKEKNKKRAYSKNEICGWTGNPYLKLYYSKKDNTTQTWSEPIPLPDDINRKYHNGPASNLKDKEIIYFTRTNALKTSKKQKTVEPINRLEIYYAKKVVENKWQTAIPFQHNNPIEYSIGHPAISPDGKLIYFISDMPGGFGETDLYYCEKINDTTWTEPINLGGEINTGGKENFPTMDNSGTLYFSSNGHPGMGGLDIFSAKGSKAEWKEVSNLKYPYNSSKDDFGIIFDNTLKGGYLSSNRDSETGTDDIYSFKPSPPPAIIKDKVITTETITENFIPLYKTKAIVKKNTNKIKIIYYDFNKSSLRTDAIIELNKIIPIIKNNKNINVILSSHADSRGNNDYNYRLSKRRCKSVANYFISNGIDKKNIVQKCFGETRLANKCKNGIKCSEKEQQINRRTEIEISEISNKLFIP